MSETIILLTAAISIGLFHDTRKPKEYTLELENGKYKNVLIEDNGKYACPTYCAAQHLHTAVICTDDCEIVDDAYQIHTSNHPSLNISLNGQTVLAMERVESKKGKAKTAMTAK